MTIDHLRVDHRVTVLRDFTDANGVTLCAGETGILRGLGWDQIKMEIHIQIERASGKADLVFPMRTTFGPRNGHMKEFFEMGEDVSTPRVLSGFHERSKREVIVPPPKDVPAPRNDSAWDAVANSTDGPDRLEEIEKEMRAAIPYIGVAASIAELYAQRMRAFQCAGNQPRAIVAFKLAMEWMNTYASWATSGGEGAALSHERDQFHAHLVHEFGYDPTKEKL